MKSKNENGTNEAFSMGKRQKLLFLHSLHLQPINTHEVFNISSYVRLDTEKPITLSRPETLIRGQQDRNWLISDVTPARASFEEDIDQFSIYLCTQEFLNSHLRRL